jgi:hypothetical protein
MSVGGDAEAIGRQACLIGARRGVCGRGGPQCHVWGRYICLGRVEVRPMTLPWLQPSEAI